MFYHVISVPANSLSYFQSSWFENWQILENASSPGCFHFQIIQASLAADWSSAPRCEKGFAKTGEALVSAADEIIFVGSPGVDNEKRQPYTSYARVGGKDAFTVCEDVNVQHVRNLYACFMCSKLEQLFGSYSIYYFTQSDNKESFTKNPAVELPLASL